MEPEVPPGGHHESDLSITREQDPAAVRAIVPGSPPGPVPDGREPAQNDTTIDQVPRPAQGDAGTAAAARSGTTAPDPVLASQAQEKGAQGRQGIRQYHSADNGVGCGSSVELTGDAEPPSRFGRRGRTASDSVLPSKSRSLRSLSVTSGGATSTSFPSIASPREAAVAAVTCCGSRRKVDTAERLVLPPRRAHCRGSSVRLAQEHRQEVIVTWSVAVVAVLGLPLIVSCAYTLLLSLEAERMDAAARVQLPWIQLSAVAAIGVTFVVVAARSWLRWPARSSSAFCTQLLAAMLCVAITAGHFYGAHNAAVAVNGEPGQPILAEATGSLQCVVLDLDNPVGGFCDVSTRVVAVPVGPNGTMLADIDAHLRGLLQASHAAVSASSLLVGAQASRDVVDRCVNGALLPWLCESALPTCSNACSPMKPCRSWCVDIRNKCPFLVDKLQEFVQPDGVLDTIIEPVVRHNVSFAAYFQDLLTCDTGEHWRDGETCSAPATATKASMTIQGPCNALLHSVAARAENGTATAGLRWRWSAVRTIAASIASAFCLALALFCGEFVPVPCLVRKKAQRPVPFSTSSTDGSNSDEFSVQATDAPTDTIWSPTESVSLDSNGVMSDMFSPNAYLQHGGRSTSRSGGAAQSLEGDSPATLAVDAFVPPLQESPVARLRAGRVRREVLPPVSESLPQAPEVACKTTWASPRRFRRSSPLALAQKSPAVLMRRGGGFTGGERGRVRSSTTLSRPRSAVDDASSTESEADAIASRLLDPSVQHVLDYRNFVAAAVLGCSGVCLLRLGLVAEYASNAGSAAAFDVVAVVSVAVAITSLIDWRFIYAEGVSIYRHGERRYLRMRAADTASLAARVRFRLLWLRARWRELFGVHGRYFKQRLILTEAAEIIVQIVGLLDRVDAAGNSETVFVVSLLVFNVAGAAVLHSRESSSGGAEVSLLFELVCDVAFLIYLSVVVSSDTVAITPAQVVGLLVPSFVTLITIRTLNRVVIMQLAASDAADAGVVKHLGATTTRSLRQFRVHVETSAVRPGKQCQCDNWEQRRSVVVDVSDAELPSCSQELLRGCRKGYLWVVLLVVVPTSFAAVVRLVVADATCAARVGPLWSGVTASSKTLLDGGFFSEPVCRVDRLTHLDLRDAEVQGIGDDILQFTALREIDARGNKKLLHVSAAVTKLPALERLRLDGTVAARSILWGSANLTEFPNILRAVAEVELLDLSGNHLSVVEDADVAALESLHVLILSNNGLVSLPERLGKHSRLSVLLASNNSISEVPQGLVPLIRRLNTLDLSHNELTELPSALGSHVFDYLNVSNNNVTELHWGASGITRVPKAIFTLPLRALVLSENGLRDIPPEISLLSQLEFLDVSRNALAALPAGMGQLRNLRTLIAHTNYFNDASASSVWELPKLQSADFACCSLRTVPDSVWLSSTLTHLDLSFNPLGNSDVSRVAAELVTSPIRALSLESTWVTGVPTVLLNTAVSETLQGVVLPGSVGRADPDGVQALDLGCSHESGGVEDLLRCGSVPVNWPRSKVLASCAFAHAIQPTNVHQRR